MHPYFGALADISGDIGECGRQQARSAGGDLVYSLCTARVTACVCASLCVRRLECGEPVGLVRAEGEGRTRSGDRRQMEGGIEPRGGCAAESMRTSGYRMLCAVCTRRRAVAPAHMRRMDRRRDATPRAWPARLLSGGAWARARRVEFLVLCATLFDCSKRRPRIIDALLSRGPPARLLSKTTRTAGRCARRRILPRGPSVH